MDIELEELPCLIDIHEALADGAINDRAGDRRQSGRARRGSAMRPRSRKRLQDAHLVVSQDYVHQRIVNAQMEPREPSPSGMQSAACSEWSPAARALCAKRDTLAQCLNMKRDKVELICPDVAGGFRAAHQSGARTADAGPGGQGTRPSGPLDQHPGRGHSSATTRARTSGCASRLGFSREGDIIACAAELTGNVGAYTVAFVPLSNSYRVLPGPYHVPLAAVSIRGVMTNTVPTAPYRGAGRPEATHAMERTLDSRGTKAGDRPDGTASPQPRRACAACRIESAVGSDL